MLLSLPFLTPADRLAGRRGRRLLSFLLAHVKLITGSWRGHKASLHERSPRRSACLTVDMTAVAGPAEQRSLECGVFDQKTNAIFCRVCFYSTAGGVCGGERAEIYDGLCPSPQSCVVVV